MKKAVKQIFALGVVIFLSFFVQKARAYYDPGYAGEGSAGGGTGAVSTEKWEDVVYGKPDEFNLESSVHAVDTNLFISLIQLLYGPQKEEYQLVMGKGAIGSVTGLIGSLYSNPPVSSQTYFADVLHNLGFTKTAYAQGTGFTELNKLLPIWKASRNLAYICFVLFFLYIGLAVMLRVKISPQTAITIQNALPKLVIALILVTFSYAIAGLMIDLIYVVISVVVVALKEPIIQAGGNFKTTLSTFNDLSFLSAMGLLFEGFFNSGISLIAGSIGAIIGALAGALAGPMAILGAITGALLAELILGVIVLFCVFKLFTSLVMCYIQIIISVITGPIQIMFGVISEKQGGFGSWFKNLIANVLVFPAVSVFLLIGWLLVNGFGPDWTPPVIAQTSGNFITSILGLGIMLMSPKITDIVKNAFKTKPTDYGRAIGENLNAPVKTFTTLGGIASAGGKIRKSWQDRFVEGKKPPEGAEPGRSNVV